MPGLDHTAVLQRAIERWNHGDLDGYLGLYAPRILLHSVPPGFPSGVEGVKKMYQGMWSTFPGSTIEVEDVFGQGEKVACRYTVRASHHSSGEQVTFAGITILHFADGKCVERWDFDRQET